MTPIRHLAKIQAVQETAMSAEYVRDLFALTAAANVWVLTAYLAADITYKTGMVIYNEQQN
mgnify:CR=1 FL=1